ncbi:MAG TPA: hypothetical protein VEL02_17000 [Jatrophihabitantaceae bacterium]|nr:hypothetical protein [Jatrophihabitantaceae bacterium]
MRSATLIAAAAVAGAVVAGCTGHGHATPKVLPPFTVRSVQSGFITAHDLGDGAIQFADTGHGAHIVYTPPDSIPTCPYVQRADDVTVTVQPAVELPGGNSTGRVIVGPRDASRTPLPVVTQGAVVFKNDTLAVVGMKTVQAESAKCPAAFTVLGGPPVIIGDYKVNQRPFELAGWHGFAQQLAHTFPPGMDDPTYDDLVTVVVQKANVILYVGFEQTKQTGERADSSSRVRAAMQVALNRLG